MLPLPLGEGVLFRQPASFRTGGLQACQNNRLGGHAMGRFLCLTSRNTPDEEEWGDVRSSNDLAVAPARPLRSVAIALYHGEK